MGSSLAREYRVRGGSAYLFRGERCQVVPTSGQLGEPCSQVFVPSCQLLLGCAYDSTEDWGERFELRVIRIYYLVEQWCKRVFDATDDLLLNATRIMLIKAALSYHVP